MAMTAIAIDAPAHIRKVSVPRDLLAVADLIEVCFTSTLDEDGRDYLRHLRWAARDSLSFSWLQGTADRLSAPLYGFVWEEAGRIIGNLSLIPLLRRGRIYHLIANVAVHPEYRRRGIGRQLTQTALDYLRQRGADTAWLQVRDDNPPAYTLYQSLGFIERARRTTWQASPSQPFIQRQTQVGINIGPRRSQDWDLQMAWLKHTYPPEVAWNLPINLSRLSPAIWNRFLRFMRNENQQQWMASCGDKPVGFLAWEPLRASADMLWLGVRSEEEDQAVLALLQHARDHLSRYRRPLSVNYPAGWATESFIRAGFVHHQTLVWMNVGLK